MAKRKKSLYDSKSAETCPCGCCKWHSSVAVRAVLAIMFVLIVVSLAATLIFASNRTYFSSVLLSFFGVIFLIVMIGWVFGFFCSCRGIHWHRHGYDWIDASTLIAKRRYAKGEITKREYDRLIRDLN